MTRRSELAVIAYTLAVVLLAFVQAVHDVYDVPAEPSPASALLIASTTALEVRP